MIRQLLILFLHIELMQNVQNYDLSQLLVLILVIAVLLLPLRSFLPDYISYRSVRVTRVV